ncbi:hypothetical protein TNCT_17271 [Trichonephila clavata]|uniref:Uncharacterized protein n=1 Tax=Trichonephila clavata TaxID=2740835 RepID=A0A8X6FD60_TRICU|nr:hypothetical protein TNCT_17271 [Trichonephila clavata]
MHTKEPPPPLHPWIIPVTHKALPHLLKEEEGGGKKRKKIFTRGWSCFCRLVRSSLDATPRRELDATPRRELDARHKFGRVISPLVGMGEISGEWSVLKRMTSAVNSRRKTSKCNVN